MNPPPIQQTEPFRYRAMDTRDRAMKTNQTARFREPGIVTVFHFIGTLSLLGGALLSSLALFDKEHALGLFGISAIINGLMMFGFASVISKVAETAWLSKKANEQRETLLTQARENAKALQWLIDNSTSSAKN